ncbi:hypothetical protein CALCODRAFT_462354 [Calocera cornea HHB12733]|uniref:Rrn7/TAF1B C-terminal cyclin domain-containing protein n=1 Tax=Calocera cornea HHB12733 TaxID=1353952 RepID=A0A165KCS9_9BASI|nr:hypothetical protein CALCODRAFT_462354 [Calocera cornea HHB12733]
MVRPCPVCKSRKWHREPLSALIVCAEGHVLPNYRNETTEVQEPGQHQLSRRAVKRPKRATVELSSADPKLYHGDRARFHYLQCLQLLFRKQLNALIRLWALPHEFEVIARDVWAMHLALLGEDIPAEPLHAAAAPPLGTSLPRAGGGTSTPAGRPPASPSTPTPESDRSSNSELELAQLLSEASATSSSSSGDEQQPPSAGPSAAPPGRKGRRRGTLHKSKAAAPGGNLAVLVCALWVLRVPATYADLIRLVERYELPYLAPLHSLPEEMTLHLTTSTAKALTPRFPPNVMVLHTLASRLARGMAGYGVVLPELNAAPVLWRAVRALNGSPLLYTLSKRLLSTLDIPLTLHPSLTPLLHPPPPDAPSPVTRKHHLENIPASLALLGGVVLCLKLMYGLDGRERVPKDEGDPLRGMPRVGEWLGSLREARERRGRDILKVFPRSVLDMTDAEMDEYLELAPRVLVDPREKVDHPDREFKDQFFPLPPPGPGQPSTQTPASTYPPYSKFTATALSRDPKALQPGSKHVIYSRLDRHGTIPEEYELVLQVAADWARVDLEDVLTTVEVYERRLETTWKERRAAKRRLSRADGDEQDLRHQRSRSVLPDAE